MSFKFFKGKSKRLVYSFQSPGIMNNRFILHLPQDLGVPQLNHMVHSVSGLRYLNNQLENITLVLRDSINLGLRTHLIDLINNSSLTRTEPFLFVLEILNAVGDVICSYHIYGRIIEVRFSDSSYENDDISTVELIISPTHVQSVIVSI